MTSPDGVVDETQTATLAFWLPCGAANFAHRIADEPLVGADSRQISDHRDIPEPTAWRKLGLPPATPSSSLVARTVWAAAHRGWKGTYGIRERDADGRPKKFVMNVDRDGRLLTGVIDSVGLHRWSLDGGSPAELLSELRGFVADRRVKDAAQGGWRYVETVSDWYEAASAAEQDAGRNDGDIYIGREYLGYLPFFQQNMLLGGLFNPAFVPAEFFESADYKAHRRPPSLSELIEQLMCSEVDVTAGDAEIRESALLRFLDVTFEKSLVPMKWRLERARRELLASALGTIHRKTRLTQLREELASPEAFDQANEAQIRGYVLLVSAKLAILENVESHIKVATADEICFNPELKQRSRAWIELLSGISNNVAGLENAMHHSWMTRSLYEQEQTRAEQEAIAEIERVSAGEGRPRTSGGTWFTLFALVPAFAGLAYAGASGDATIGAINMSAVAIGAGAALLIALGYILTSGVRRYKSGDARIFYESNLRLDLHVEPLKVGELLGKIDTKVEYGSLKLREIRRGALRTERINDEDAVFKVHFDGKLQLPRSRRRFMRRHVPIHIICELFHHRPSASLDYLLRELRVICPAGTSMDPHTLRDLAVIIAEAIVDPMLLNDDEKLAKRIREGAESSTVIFEDHARAMRQNNGTTTGDAPSAHHQGPEPRRPEKPERASVAPRT